MEILNSLVLSRYRRDESMKKLCFLVFGFEFSEVGLGGIKEGTGIGISPLPSPACRLTVRERGMLAASVANLALYESLFAWNMLVMTEGI